jgi:hypothetical protein
MQCLTKSQFPATSCVELIEGWYVTFGAQIIPTDLELTQYVINITATWDIAAKAYHRPWQIFLSAQQWRAGDQGGIVVQACD